MSRKSARRRNAVSSNWSSRRYRDFQRNARDGAVILEASVDRSASVIPAATIAAYLATDYKVIAPEPFVLHIGCHSPELALWLKHKRADSALFITAWNPLSVPTPAPENHAAQQKLLAEIKARGLPYLEGEGCDPSGLWPGESSLLVFDIALEAAGKLAAQFRQNGFVYAGSDAMPRLILLR